MKKGNKFLCISFIPHFCWFHCISITSFLMFFKKNVESIFSLQNFVYFLHFFISKFLESKFQRGVVAVARLLFCIYAIRNMCDDMRELEHLLCVYSKIHRNFVPVIVSVNPLKVSNFNSEMKRKKKVRN